MKTRFLYAVTILAFASCSGIQASAPPPQPAALPALRSAALKPGTIFVAVGDGTLPGSVVFSSPPYTVRGETAAERSPLAVALTKSDSLIVAPYSDDGALWLVPPPYDVQPKTIASFSWGGGMALDDNDNIFLAQRRTVNARSSYLVKYDAPGYTHARRFAASTNRFVTAVKTLPGGALAVGSQLNGPRRSLLAGSLDIYRPPFTKSTKIASLQFVQAMTVVPAGLIVAVCPPCSNIASRSYLALVAPPYTSVTKIFARLPSKVFASAVTSSPTGDVFVNEGGVLYRYAPPYTKVQPLTNTSGVLEAATATDANGNLFFGSTTQSGVCGGFTIYRLPAPYTAQPTAIFCTPGIPAGMILSR